MPFLNNACASKSEYVSYGFSPVKASRQSNPKDQTSASLLGKVAFIEVIYSGGSHLARDRLKVSYRSYTFALGREDHRID
jgi:hypothetical protein